MPLPSPNSEWPPKPWDVAYKAYAENEAWYLGDPDELEKIYRETERVRPSHRVKGQEYSGGVVGTMSRFFWGRPIPAGQARSRIHVPAAADLATLSSDLIFSEGVEVQLTKEKTNESTRDRMDLIANSDTARATFNTMGELKAVLGATVITSEWDTEIADNVWLGVYGVDVVIPEFRKGRMVACTMWTEYRDGNTYWRHLERHETGRIEHALFRGTDSKLGQRVPLPDRPETEHLAKLVDADSAILTGIDRLTASYNLNMPTRAWRKNGELAFAGRSDFANLYGLFDALDETFSSWMRDLKLGAGKLLLDQSMLETVGRGQGGFFDTGQEMFVPLNAPGNAGTSGQKLIQDVQFEIRVEQHEKTAYAIYREILRAAGYSQSAWGDYSSGSQQTATEVQDRDKASERTRDKKTLYDKVAIAQQSSVALELDGLLFPGKGGGKFDLPTVVFPAASQIDPEKNSRVIQLLDAASAVSVKRKVEMANPDWDDDAIGDEVKAIMHERTVASPFDFTDDPESPNGERPEHEEAK